MYSRFSFARRERDASKVSSQHGVLYHWAWELLCLLVAFASLGAIAGLLIYFDGEIVPEWRYSLTLNTIVAILSTVARAAMVMVLAEIISQEKWSWFTKEPRPLRQLQQFDHASRGVWGSFGLLGHLRFGLRGHELAILASLATIVSVAVGPFSQQAVKSVLCTRQLMNEQASLPMAPWLPGQDSYLYPVSEMWQIGTRVQAAMIGSLAEDNPRGGNGSVTLRATCATGNCTFPERHGVPHSTMGLCSKCVDTTHLVNVPKYRGDNITIGHQVIRLNASTIGDYAPWFDVRRTNITLKQGAEGPAELDDISPHALANITVLTATKAKCTEDGCSAGELRPGQDAWIQDYGVLATSCVLYMCRRDVEAYVEAGQLFDFGHIDEDSLEADGEPMAFGGERGYRDEDYLFPSNDWVSLKSPCLVNNSRYDFDTNIKAENISRPVTGDPYWLFDDKKVPVPCVYGVDWIYHKGLQRFVQDSLLRESCKENEFSNGTSVLCFDAWWLRNLYHGGEASFESIRDAFQNLALSTTNFWRNDGWGEDRGEARIGPPAYPNGFLESQPYMMNSMLSGVTHDVALCVQLDWFWLLLPVILALITLTLLAIMIVYNYRNRAQPVWKSEIMPLIFYGPSTDLDPKGNQTSEDLSNLHRKAQDIKVQFEHGSGATRSSFVVSSGPEPHKASGDQTEMDTLLEDGANNAATMTLSNAEWDSGKGRSSIMRKPVPEAPRDSA